LKKEREIRAKLSQDCRLFLPLFLDVIDLSDQTGVRKNLLKNPTDYAIKYMDERDTLILVKIESK
jgi:hypothetical protein